LDTIEVSRACEVAGISAAGNFGPGGTNVAAAGARGLRSKAVLADDFLPQFDFSDTVETVAQADAATTWSALMDADLIEVGRHRPLVGLLGALRILPDVVWHGLHGEHPPAAPQRLTLLDTTRLPMSDGGWVLLGEKAEEAIALGLVGKFWRPVIQYAEVDATAFRDFAEPGFAKTIYELGTRALDDHRTLLWATMRTASTDGHARVWFRRYWTFGVAYGAHVLVHGLLDTVRDDAERRAAAPGGGRLGP
jgi:hypothetical protein